MSIIREAVFFELRVSILLDKRQTKARGKGKMPRASMHYIPGYVWHITHRCHNFFAPSRLRVANIHPKTQNRA